MLQEQVNQWYITNAFFVIKYTQLMLGVKYAINAQLYLVGYQE